MITINPKIYFIISFLIFIKEIYNEFFFWNYLVVQIQHVMIWNYLVQIQHVMIWNYLVQIHNDLPLNETSLYPGWQSTDPDGGDDAGGGGGEGDGGGLITGLEV